MYMHCYVSLSNKLLAKPEPNMLEILPIIPSSTSQKVSVASYPLFLFILMHVISLPFHFVLSSFHYFR